ncbi:MAG: hypothetical protein HYV97_00945 [Bdellovibrio sp.]|nr:hypothetical protein [Bdellovibrio sp.]
MSLKPGPHKLNCMKRKIIFGLFFLFALSLLVVWAVLSYPYSSGSRSGRLVRLSQKGWVLKTYEGTLDLGSGDNLTWNFSVRDSKLGAELSKSMGERVTLKYKELIAPIIYETKYNVTGFQVDLAVTPEARGILCRFVNVIRNYPELTAQIRAILERDDVEMLKTIRQQCQSAAPGN